jgi:hypothetical protein
VTIPLDYGGRTVHRGMRLDLYDRSGGEGSRRARTRAPRRRRPSCTRPDWRRRHARHRAARCQRRPCARLGGEPLRRTGRRSPRRLRRPGGCPGRRWRPRVRARGPRQLVLQLQFAAWRCGATIQASGSWTSGSAERWAPGLDSSRQIRAEPHGRRGRLGASAAVVLEPIPVGRTDPGDRAWVQR